MNVWARRMVIVVSLLILGSGTAGAVPLGTGFTYQGQLNQSGSPVTGVSHFRFSLWDAAAGGTQVGTSQIVSNVLVTGGIFTVTLNGSGQFGTAAFDGDARWLQIEVCADAGCGSTTVLSPRQALTGAPYAHNALESEYVSRTLGGVGVRINPGSVTNSPGMLSGTSINDLVLGSFLDGGVAHGFISTGYTSNTRKVSIGRASSSDVPTKVFEPLLTVVSNSGNVGIGTSAPQTSVHVVDTAPVMILQDNASASSQAGYLGFWNNSAVETGWVGFGNSGDPDLTVRNARSFGDVVLSPGAGGQVVMNANAKVGPAGQYYATGGDENLKIVRGTIDRTGGEAEIVYGSGFTAVISGSGTTDITFNTPFLSPPTVTATGTACTGCFVRFCEIVSVSNTTVRIAQYNRSDGGFAGGDFNFIAIGPR